MPPAHIVFNTSLRPETRRGLEQRGYRVVYFQKGSMPNFSVASVLSGTARIDAYIAVREDLVTKLGLEYREVRWTTAG